MYYLYILIVIYITINLFGQLEGIVENFSVFILEFVESSKRIPTHPVDGKYFSVMGTSNQIMHLKLR